jgi:hypothetical protein
MPLELGIWRLGAKPERIAFSALDSEKRLEDALVQDLSILSPDLLLIGRQIPTAQGKFIDMLAVDADGDLTVIELKRNRTPREVVAQVLDYASWVQRLSYEQVRELYADKNPGKQFETAFAEVFKSSPPEELNKAHQLLIVAAELDPETERIIGYLSGNYGVPINAAFFRYFRDGEHEYLTRSWLIDPTEVEEKSARTPAQSKRESWNGSDFYVAFGEGPNRNWEDARQYGFVAAGGGRWYSRTLEQLFVGARIFVMIPGVGYVGVGKVAGPAVPAKDFKVTIGGNELALFDVPTKAAYDRNAEDPDNCEYIVPVEWIKTAPVSEAYWETGMFANQNSACRLRNQFTLERLGEHFGLSES